MSKENKFNQIWSNQTNLGKRFGLSAIAAGKLLVEEGLGRVPELLINSEKASTSHVFNKYIERLLRFRFSMIQTHDQGLKDQKTKSATEKALNEGYVKLTPLKDGTPYFMWNIEKNVL